MFTFGRHMTIKNKSSKQGFTLLEVLIALAVFSVISVSLFTSFRTYSGTINQERKMAMESVRIQKSFREIEDYIRLSTQNISYSQGCITNNGVIHLIDMDDKIASGHQPQHKLDVILTNKQLSIIKNPDGSPSDERIILSPNVKKICIKKDNRSLVGVTEGNEKIIISIKSGVEEMRELSKFIPFSGQFRDR